MTDDQTVDDTEYAGDVEDDQAVSELEPTDDPASIPPDEGDAGPEAAK